MADWVETYLSALRKRDEVEKANIQLYDYCAKLADQRAELQKQTKDVSEEKPATPPPGFGLRRVTSPTRPESPGVSQMRADLTRAQAERAELQGKLEVVSKELEVMKVKSKQDTRKLSQLQASVNQLSLKVRDREEELKGKAKLVEDVQDENVTLNLQLNMAEERSKTLKKENQELVDRWMKRMGVEAERMNDKNLREEKG
jgi:flagellar motor protein MotB